MIKKAKKEMFVGYIGNLPNSELYSPDSYLCTADDGTKYFTKSVTDKKKLKVFEDFCKKENIIRQEFLNIPLGENAYHIFEGINFLCGSKSIYDKLVEHLKINVPLKRIKIAYLTKKEDER